MAIGSLYFDPFEVLLDEKGEPWVLGKGSFGTTYKVRHQKLDRICALKVIRDDLVHGTGEGAERETARFFAEVKALANMHHHGIAVVFEYHDRPDEGYFYYAMEFCKGGNLQELVERDGPLSWPVARWFLLQVAEALKYAHGCGLLHRDIKPANIMLSEPWPEQTVKLIDFGILQPLEGAVAEGGNIASTHGGEGVFNDATASPEQMLSGMLDARSDLYSLGVTLWWLLIGRNPFAGQSRAQLISERLRSDYTSELPSGLEPEAREILLRLLAKEPEDRFSDAQALINHISGSLQQAASQVAPPPAKRAVPVPVATSPNPYDGLYSIPNPGKDLITKTAQAAIYRVTQLASGETVAAITAEAGMSQEVREGFRAAAAAREDFGTYRMIDWCSSANEEYFIASLPGGQSLLELLRKFGSARAQDALPVLASLASAFDASMERTTRGIRLELADIRVSSRSGGTALESFQGWNDIDPHSVRSLPSFQAEGEQDAGGTLDISSAGPVNPVSRFAALIYRLISGGNPPYASYFTSSGYVMMSGLSEEGNHLLAEALAGGQGEGKLASLLDRLMRLESLPTGSRSKTGSIPARAMPSSSGSPATGRTSPDDPATWKESSAPVNVPAPATTSRQDTPPPPKKSRPAWLVPAAMALLAIPVVGWLRSSASAERKTEAQRLEALQTKAQQESAAQIESLRLDMERKTREDNERIALAELEAKKKAEQLEADRERMSKEANDTRISARIRELDQILISKNSSSRDRENAFQEVKKYAEEGRIEAIVACAASYWNGKGTDKNPGEAYKLFLIGAEHGSTRSMLGLGNCFADGLGAPRKDILEAIKWWEKGASLGDSKAALKIGLAYFEGWGGLEISYQKAVEWYFKAANAKDPLGMINLAKCYETGKGVDESPEETFKWYSRAAGLGDPFALTQVGNRYLRGIGTEPNEKLATENLRKAVAEGNPEAMYLLGTCFRDGRGVDPSREEARQLFTRAANQNHAESIKALEELGGQ
jgi:TPR repeat protein/serine/threonine protein kinase